MKFNEKMLLLYAVTDRAWVGKQTLLEQIEESMRFGLPMNSSGRLFPPSLFLLSPSAASITTMSAKSRTVLFPA